jgi:hypothetical protein
MPRDGALILPELAGLSVVGLHMFEFPRRPQADRDQKLEPRRPDATAGAIACHTAALAKLAWSPNTVSVFDVDGTDAFVITEVAKGNAKLTEDDYSAPCPVGESLTGTADSKYGLCDECDSNQPRVSAYFLRLVDPHGSMLLEGGRATYDALGWISARHESGE